MDDPNLHWLAAFLGGVSAMAQTDLAPWLRDEIMVRADGTEVILDPFERLPRHILQKAASAA